MFDHQKFLAQASEEPGVYLMYNAKNEVIYVGKAKNLKKRLASYFRLNLNSTKTRSLVSHIDHIELTLVASEGEALLLEHSLIQKFKPKYNILLRDDKSYPYIFLSADKHPRISAWRGSKHKKGDYFGPYPNVLAVKDSLNLLKKLFPIRQCENTVYRNRSRPCLQYQIKRCLAPCVEGLVSDQDYMDQVKLTKLFLSGKDNQVIDYLVLAMDKAALDLDFEKAAQIRDQINAVRAVTQQQFVVNQGDNDIDIIACQQLHGVFCVQILFIRKGKIIGTRSFFPKNVGAKTTLNILCNNFIGQYYLSSGIQKDMPKNIIIEYKIKDLELLNQLLSKQAGFKITISHNPRGNRAKFLEIAKNNANNALNSHLLQNNLLQSRYQALQNFFNLANIKHMECFDISHHQGKQTIASCVVFGANGADFERYRRYNINDITAGDDYAAMEQALNKRYSKYRLNNIQDWHDFALKLEANKAVNPLPDIIFIDGGIGQFNRSVETIEKLGLTDLNWQKLKAQLLEQNITTQAQLDLVKMPLIVSIAKGVERKEGLETIFIQGKKQPVYLADDDPAAHLIWYIRDESHRYAITNHRKKSRSEFKKSSLEEIAGVGAKRRQALLKYLGGMAGLKSATVEQISSVPGISKKLAQTIKNSLE